jgi:pimeloyl-ACP methyl ester carboxylesterase
MNISLSINKNIFKFLIIAFVIICSGAIWQYVMSNYEKNKYDPPGELIEVNKHRIHIYAKGEGSPTVVFTTGSGTPCAYTDYYFIQKELLKTVRTVSYDRPGYGWSEPTNISINIGNQVEELHEVLNKAGERPPYILVAHSLSSLEVIHYAQVFKEEVCGILLIDGGNPSFYLNINEFSAKAINCLFQITRKTGLARAMGSIGVFPPFAGEDLRHKLLPNELKDIDEKMFYNKLGLESNWNSLKNINENAKTVIESGKLGDIPLVILTAGDSTKDWKESQVDLKNWSSNSKQEEIKGASHYIHWNNPDIVVERIQELISSKSNYDFDLSN